jgi:hypothetical protein
LVFALMCIVAFMWIKEKAPGTKGKSLEEIQQVWAEHDHERTTPTTPVLEVDRV